MKLCNRSPNSELIRFLGCLIVIGVHTCPYYIPKEGGIDFTQLLIACFLADGVAIFWLLSGFYAFNNDYKRIFQRYCFRNMRSAMLFGFFCFCCGAWLINPHSSLIAHLTKIRLIDFFKIFSNLIRLKNPFPWCGHYWYLFAYFLFVFSFPVWKSFATYMENSNRSAYFLFLSFCFLLVNDVTRNELAVFSHHSITAVIPAVIDILWGYLLFRNQEIVTKVKNVKVISLVMFLALNLLRASLQINNVRVQGGNAILFWYSSIGLLCGVCVCVFCLSLNFKEGVLAKIVVWLGSYTFPVYLVHMLVMDVLSHMMINIRLNTFVNIYCPKFVAKLMYSFCITSIVFICSLVTVLSARLCYSVLKTPLKYLWARGK